MSTGTVTLAVHLHGDDHLFGSRHIRAEQRPRRARKAILMADHLPHLLGRVRRKRRQHPDQRLDRLADNANRFLAFDFAGVLDVFIGAPRRAAGYCLLAERVELVDQLHHRSDRRVHLLALLDVGRHPPDGVVRFPPQRLLLRVQ
jgi:hypothetical protein